MSTALRMLPIFAFCIVWLGLCYALGVKEALGAMWTPFLIASGLLFGWAGMRLSE
jgi:hypothetical protein